MAIVLVAAVVVLALVSSDNDICNPVDVQIVKKNIAKISLSKSFTKPVVSPHTTLYGLI